MSIDFCFSATIYDDQGHVIPERGETEWSGYVTVDVADIKELSGLRIMLVHAMNDVIQSLHDSNIKIIDSSGCELQK